MAIPRGMHLPAIARRDLGMLGDAATPEGLPTGLTNIIEGATPTALAGKRDESISTGIALLWVGAIAAGGGFLIELAKYLDAKKKERGRKASKESP